MKEIEPLDAFIALGSTFLMKCKDYRNNSCGILHIKSGETYKPQELGETVCKALEEYKQYKDLEKELGIDIPTLFNNILRTGGSIWVKNKKGINLWHVESLKQRGLDKEWYLTYSNNVRVKLRDYGKTWALTKEELE